MDTPMEKRAGHPRITIRVTEAQKKALKRLAVERESSLQALLTPAVRTLAEPIT